MNIILLPESAGTQQHFTLDNQWQVTHIKTVLGLNAGDSLKVGVLSGGIGTATIKEIDNHKVWLSDIKCDMPPPAKLDLTVILALPRPKVLRRLIMDMTSIGVQHIVLVNSYRTDKSYWQSPMLNRIDEFIEEGLQQAVDTTAPMVSLKKRFKPFVEDELSVMTQSHTAVVAHPYSPQSFSDYEHNQGLPQVICIGPEGGWIDYEVNLLNANGCQTVGLGSRILRTEAAVNALCGRYLV